jgi:deferrochelatase/peroxidase EfeB
MKFAAGSQKFSVTAMAYRMVQADDVQAIVKTGFGSLKGAAYLLLRVIDPVAARIWLRAQSPASAADIGARSHVDETVQIAFTAPGLRALAIGKEIICRFPLEFSEGMACNENRSRRLGDIADNAPDRWEWGLGDKEPHVLVILLARTLKRAATYAKAVQASVELAGFAALPPLLTTDMDDVEPFGFRDGISQPSFDWDGARQPGTAADRDYTNEIALGELLLGHRNEYGLFTERPLVAPGAKNPHLLPEAWEGGGRRDLGLNGTYLVYRQLEQDVRGFWTWVAEEAARARVSSDDLAEAMVGRRLDGQPLQDLLIRAIPGIDAKDSAWNGFTFDTDPDGLSCPIGAHIRRANPRTGDLPGGRQGPIDTLLAMLGLGGCPRPGAISSALPWPQNHTVWPGGAPEDDAIASARFHRILRRSREYGTRITREQALDPNSPHPKAGLHFICLNANIARQFEFVQGAWMASATFGALSGEQDPLLGNREPFPRPPVSCHEHATNGFTRPGAEPTRRRSTGLPRFVTVRGGAYFFLPGLRAFNWIAS